MNLFLTSSVSFVAQDLAQRAKPITKNKKLIFIPTAAEAEKHDLAWLDTDRQALIKAGYQVSDYSITNQTPPQVQAALAGAGTICVAGGNTYFLLHQALLSGFDKIIRQLVETGVIYIGSSAGSCLAGPNIETELDDRSVVPELTDYTGLNLTDVAVLPHWTSPKFAKAYQPEFKLLYQKRQKMILLNDQQYLHVKDDWYQIVTVEK